MQGIIDNLASQLAAARHDLHTDCTVDSSNMMPIGGSFTPTETARHSMPLSWQLPRIRPRLAPSIKPQISTRLGLIEYASVAIVRLAYERHAIPMNLDASGFVVPAVENMLLTACSWASSKWPQLQDDADGTVIFRASAGRYGDARPSWLSDSDLIHAAHRDLELIMKIDAKPVAADVTRWTDSFPQYTIGHSGRIGSVELQLQTIPGLALAGAAYTASAYRRVSVAPQPPQIASARAFKYKMPREATGGRRSAGAFPHLRALASLERPTRHYFTKQ